MARNIKIGTFVIIGALVVLAILQSIYTIGFGRYCVPHFAGKRIYFSTYHNLESQWQIDFLGISSRTMNDLLEHHQDITLGAFNSSGNMHNPKVVAFASVFRNTIAKYVPPFTSTDGIEKPSVSLIS